ncbi:hypothetical protein N9A30_08485 [Flavobacteriaceae bacterium]|nr:hypothetical protein [Flavobacteriaceae bacterium]
MKKLILITILTPIISFSQTYYDGALNFQNNIRSFYDLNELKYDSLLSVSALPYFLKEGWVSGIRFPI